MSNMKYNKGKLIPSSMDEVLSRYSNASIDNLAWDTKGDFEIISGSIYAIEFEVKGGELNYMDNLSKNDDGTYNFETYHYNGGGYWTESLIKELSK